jgi:hypothetical protein
MNEKTRKAEGDERVRHETCMCPFCWGQRVLHDQVERYGDFFSHLNQARIEVLLAFRWLLDQRIADLQRNKRKVTKIEVE